MLDILENICAQLDRVADLVADSGGEPAYAIAHNNWSFPSIDRYDLADMARSLSAHIRENSNYEMVEDVSRASRINGYLKRLKFLCDNTIPNIWGNPAVGVPAYIFTIESLRRLFDDCFVVPSEISSEEVILASQALKKATGRIRALENRLKEFEPRSNNLSDMIDRIHSAHDAADQLPTDLASLEESRARVEQAVVRSEKDQAHVSNSRDQIDEVSAKIQISASEAEAVLAKCQVAYSSATSQGLAAAFNERSVALDKSMWAWVIGLIVALGLGSIFGTSNLQRLLDLMKLPQIPASTIVVNTLLSLLSVAAPVWFAWLSTKQIGQRFRMAEDYAFKASVSRAYEGYRREAARIDSDLEMRLLASALDRMDEQPLRLVESVSHGSPVQEIINSPFVRQAVSSVPGFAASVAESARHALEALRGSSSGADKKVEGPPV